MPAKGQTAAPACGAAQRALLALIRGYQVSVAPMYAGSCRFVPSCSSYASEAVLRHGALRGAGLALRRLARCHPFGGHGLDPVPACAPSELRRGGPNAPSELQRGTPNTPPVLRRGTPFTPPELRDEPTAASERLTFDRSCKNTL